MFGGMTVVEVQSNKAMKPESAKLKQHRAEPMFDSLTKRR
jgi:hypothetical protein